MILNKIFFIKLKDFRTRSEQYLKHFLSFLMVDLPNPPLNYLFSPLLAGSNLELVYSGLTPPIEVLVFAPVSRIEFITRIYQIIIKIKWIEDANNKI